MQIEKTQTHDVVVSQSNALESVQKAYQEGNEAKCMVAVWCVTEHPEGLKTALHLERWNFPFEHHAKALTMLAEHMESVTQNDQPPPLPEAEL